MGLGTFEKNSPSVNHCCLLDSWRVVHMLVLWVWTYGDFYFEENNRWKTASLCISLWILFLSWLSPQDLLDSDWASVRSVLEQADIVVIKYSVNDKLAFQQVRNGYAPRLRPLLRHWGMPVILVAVGARLNGERWLASAVLLTLWGLNCHDGSVSLSKVLHRVRIPEALQLSVLL